MESIVSYIVQVNIYLSLFFLGYLFFFRHDALFRRNRYYLLGAAVLSAIIPLLEMPDFASEQAAKVVDSGAIEQVMVWTESSIQGAESSTWGWREVILLTYAVGALVMLIRFIYAFAGIVYLTIKHGIQRKKGAWVVNLNEDWQPFSFFFLLFWSAQPDMSKEEQEQVWQHELAHIKQLHSIDIILFEVLGIIFWFNPVCWMYKQAIRQVHEFLADQAVAGHHSDKSAYSTLLLGQFLDVRQLHLSNHFMNKNFLKQRIMMLNQSNNQKSAIYKILLALPIVLACIFIQACSDRVLEPSNAKSNLEFKKVKTYTFGDKEAKKIEYTAVLSEGTIYRYQYRPENEGDAVKLNLGIQKKDEGGEKKYEKIEMREKNTGAIQEFTFEAPTTGIYALSIETADGEKLRGEMDLSFFRKESNKPKKDEGETNVVKEVELKDGLTFEVATEPNQILMMKIEGEPTVETPHEGWNVIMYDNEGNKKAANLYEGKYFSNFAYKCRDSQVMKFVVKADDNATPKSRIIISIQEPIKAK